MEERGEEVRSKRTWFRVGRLTMSTMRIITYDVVHKVRLVFQNSLAAF